jgi:diguanylate cyclase (GGDEF)-like protein
MIRARRADPGTVVGALAFVLVTVCLVVDAGSAPRVFWSTIPLVDAAVAAIAYDLSRKPGLSRAERHLWLVLAVECLVMLVGDATQAVLVWTRAEFHSGLPGPVTDICNLLGTIPALIVLLRFPVAADIWSVRVRYLLDAASVAVGAGVLMWFLMARTMPGVETGGSRLFGSAVLAMTGFAATKLVLTGALPVRARAAVPIATGAVLQGYSYGLLIPGADAHLPLAGLMAAAGLLCIGVRIHRLGPIIKPDVVRARRRYSLLPYATLFVIFGLVPFVVRAGVGVDFWVVIGALFAATCLVVVRQVLALRENATLLTRLDASLHEARGLHDQLRHQATHDRLTGLANRTLFDERLDEVTGAAAVMMVDLDGFKDINDTHGHHAGDAVLGAVADRLRRCVPPSATAARLGGDEFAVLLPGADAPTARLLAERFAALLAEPVLVDGVALRAGASVGIAAGVGTAPGALLRDADTAMYAEKRRILVPNRR